MTAQIDDADCVARCLLGESSAFEPLVRRYERVLFTMAYRLTANVEDARDATQNAFVRAYSHLDSFDPHRSFFSWMYRIAVNETLNLRRARPVLAPLTDMRPADAGVEQAIDAARAKDRVREAIVRLPKDLRDVIVLRHFAELSYQDIAEVLGIPDKTVKSRLFSARQRLGTLLAVATGMHCDDTGQSRTG